MWFFMLGDLRGYSHALYNFSVPFPLLKLLLLNFIKTFILGCFGNWKLDHLDQVTQYTYNFTVICQVKDFTIWKFG